MKKKNQKKYRAAEKQESFLDPSTLIAVVAVGFMWFLWQSYMNKKYPPQNRTQTRVEQNIGAGQRAAGGPAAGSPASGIASDTNGGPSGGAAGAPLATQQKAQQAALGSEQVVTYEDQELKLEISSYNMGIKSATLKNYQTPQGSPVVLVEGEDFNSPQKPFAVQVLLQSSWPLNINFRLEKKGSQIIGTARLKNLRIVRTFNIKANQFYMESTTRVENAGPEFVGLQLYTMAKVDPSLGQTSFLIPTFERQEFYVDDYQSGQRWPVDPQAAIQPQEVVQARVASLGTQYFAQAILDKSFVRPGFKVYSRQGSRQNLQQSQGGPIQQAAATYIYGQLNFKRLNRDSIFNTHQILFLGPKKYSLLARIQSSMTSIIDFGWFSSIAKGILFLMHFFNQYISNWGLIIILLTCIVRLLVLPFNLISYKSMRVMAQVQPLIKQIQEKYKDKPQEKNQHIMQIMRDNKANPLMGCLPMLLQIPVFFALYRVLASSVDLYQAPFMLWIQDLSLKDPYYTLPILVGASFFIQQKITPNTMDEMQRKVMMFLPLMFTVFMLNLPSGLTLYIFINTLFGLVQQYVFTKRADSTAAS